MVVRRKGAGTFVAARQAPPPARARECTLLLCGLHAPDALKRTDVSWFVTYELYRGVINNFDGRVRLLGYPELAAHLDGAPAETFGLIMLNPPSGAEERARTAGVPWVAMRPYGIAGQLPPNTVAIDRLSGVVEGMSYLIQQLGHRAVALIIPPQHTPRHSERMAGYAIGLHTFGIPYDEQLVAYAPYGMAENGAAAVRELRRRPAAFTAVFVSTDIKALGAIEALEQDGLRVPGDVSVMGFDDAPGAEQARPPLTTVRVPRYELGATAVAMLERRMLSPGADCPGIRLQSRLVVRGSCGPAPARNG